MIFTWFLNGILRFVYIALKALGRTASVKVKLGRRHFDATSLQLRLITIRRREILQKSYLVESLMIGPDHGPSYVQAQRIRQHKACS